MEERVLIMKAIDSAMKAFEKTLCKGGWEDFQPIMKIEVRELRSGDNTIGESYIVDQIKEYFENAGGGEQYETK